MPLRYLIYASRLFDPLKYESLKTLLEESQRNNERAGLSGFLHVEDRIALQYLEGPADSLAKTVDRIRNDPRHTDFSVLDEGALEQRYFDNWKMALVESTTLSLFDLMGVQGNDVTTITDANPTDLITFLSANSSFLRNQPRVA